MSKRIEDFVQQNREAFDDREPSDKVWKGVERNLLSARTLWNQVTLWRAAAIVFMALSAYLLIPKDVFSSGSDSLKDFSDVEAYYIQQISDKVSIIDGFDTTEDLPDFTHDLHQLQAMYLVLKEEMKTRPSKKVKEALVLNLLVQIDLLNQQVREFEKLRSRDDDDREESNAEKAKASI